MKLFKIFALAVLGLSLCGSLAYTSDLVQASESRIKEAMEKASASEMNAVDLCVFLDSEISETLLALEMKLDNAEKGSYDKFIVENIINNKALNNLILKTPVKDLNPWQNRILNKFLPEKEDAQSKDLFRKAKLMKKDRFLCLKGKNTYPDKLHSFTLLNYNYLSFKGSEEADPLIKDILFQNPEVICLEGVFFNTDADFLYNQLKDNYAYFYVDIKSESSYLNSGLFVASKFPITEPQVHYFDELTCFDFVVMNHQNEPMGQIYFFDLQLMDNNSSMVESFMHKVSNVNLQNTVPVLLCGCLNEKGQNSTFTWLLQDCLDVNDGIIKFRSEFFGFKGNIGLFSIVNQVLYRKTSSNKRIMNDGYCIQLCGNDQDGTHGKVGVTVEEKNNKKEASAHGEISYSKTTDNGLKFTGSAKGTVTVDDKGQKSHSATLNGEIDFK